MKKTNLCLIILSLILSNSDKNFSQCLFTPTGSGSAVVNPNPFIHAAAIGGYERYLARSIQMDLLPTLLLNQDLVNSYSNIQTNGLRCTDPCSQDCRIAYCCDKYNRDINMLADINASYIFSTGYYELNSTLWSASEIDPIDRFPGYTLNPGLSVLRGIPQDINLAYDKKSLRRPIIDNFIPESVLASVNQVRIPRLVIKLFINEMNLSEKSKYLIDPLKTDDPNNNTDFSNIKINIFNLNNLSWTNTDGSTHVDVNKIEGRMWLFFIAKQFIDMGYTSLNMSQANYFFDHSSTITTPGYVNIPVEENHLTQSEKEANINIYPQNVKKGLMNLYKICSKVREYAVSKNKFILFWNQSDRIYYAYKESISNGITTFVKDLSNNGVPKYIFDFNATALRVREVNNAHLTDGRNLAIGSTQPSKPPMNEAEFNSKMPRCTSCLKAVADPGSGVNYERNGIGNSPRPWKNELPTALPNGIYYDKQPTYVYYDGGGGRTIENEPINTNSPLSCTPWSGNGIDNAGVWGYDDSRWFFEFAKVNGNNCIIDWLTYQYTNIRTFDRSDHVYFQTLPGRILKGIRPIFDNVNNFISFTTPGPTFRLADPLNQSVLNAIKNDIWKVNDVSSYNSISYVYSENAGPNYNSCQAWEGNSICYGTTTLGTYSFAVVNPDKSSIYTWHIQWSDGFWEPYTYGISRLFTPNRSPNLTFKIYLGQDNLGLDPSKYGSSGATVDNLTVTESICRYYVSDCYSDMLLSKPKKNDIIFPKTRAITEKEQIDVLNTIQKNDESKIFDIKTQVNLNNFQVNSYPQPVSDVLNLTYIIPCSGKLNIEIYNATGLIIENNISEKGKGSYTDHIDFSKFTSGFYILNFNFNGQSKLLKIIKH